MKSNMLSFIAYLLVIVGALNWGLVGAFDFDLVAALLGEGSVASRIVYVLVALSGLYVLFDRMTARRVVSNTADRGSHATR